MFIEALKIVGESWPIAVIVIGLGIGCTLMVIVRRVTKASEQSNVLNMEKEIRLKQLDAPLARVIETQKLARNQDSGRE